MNLPNKLTVMRVILIPFFVAALLYDNGSSQTMRIVANVIFIVASLTDLLMEKSPVSIIWSLISVNLWIHWQISCWYVRPHLPDPVRTAACMGSDHYHQP